MIASVKEHGILNPVIVQKINGGYVKTDLSEEEAYVYVIETNLMQRSFLDLLISEGSVESEI